ncbi:hypothetical protein HRbin36_02642 [bacterium HR36]|nr:hypothetical protein HRbin36_02642 [bacterium HR36]
MSANRQTASTPNADGLSTPLPQLALQAHQPKPLSPDQDTLSLCRRWGEGAGCQPVPIRLWRLADPRSARIVPFRSSQASRLRLGRHCSESLWPHCQEANAIFPFSAAITALVADIVARVPELAHIRVAQVHLGVTRSGRRGSGLLGRITPLRFPGGTLWRRYGPWHLTLQRYWLRGVELLYLIAFPLPRFLDLPFEEKMITILHELCHISPRFDGDLYRHTGRYCLHTRSKKAYDRRMAHLVRAYLETHPDEQKFAFLRFSARELLQKYSAIVGEWLPAPRLFRFPYRDIGDEPLRSALTTDDPGVQRSG